MQSLIQLLPDAIANQIAAGEVVQRPASVIKELLENAVDAGSTRIDVVLKDAGKTLIQVSDNGSGMSVQDARMCFERHATSKIREQNDLFGIRTLGFRGEALASIAAVAQVKLRSRLKDVELGTEIEIAASQVKKQEACAMAPGTTFMVRNLFFNVPARRNFLKSNPVETRHILNEFIRVALPHPEIHLTLTHNDTPVYDLPAGDLTQRIYALFGQDLKDKLSPVAEKAGYASFSGYIGQPEIYRKNRGEQFFFVNNRFIKSPYLNHAIAQAFQDFIPKETYPFYCIFIEIDPVHVDINIHPTKTEVKFDDERTLYVLLQSIVKRALAQTSAAPSFDFKETPTTTDIYQSQPPAPPAMPTKQGKGPGAPKNLEPRQKARTEDWETLYKPAQRIPQPPVEKPASPQLFPSPKTSAKQAETSEGQVLFQLSGGYILLERENSLLIIHQQLAHQRILFERLLHSQEGKQLPSQTLLFPQTVEFSAADFLMVKEWEEPLTQMGFEVKEFGKNTLVVYGTPAGVPTGKVREIFEEMLADIKASGQDRLERQLFEGMARSIAARTAVTPNQKLSMLELRQMVEDLFRCTAPGFAPNGKPTYKEMPLSGLADFFQ
ncbi:MAG: DNA mismatch repair endonuclease MutL [Bacteroidota bacterium]